MFDQNGHLTDQAIAALLQGKDLDQLLRLELAEHLSYCDLCLQRYTVALSDDVLLPPEVSCKAPLWRRIRARAVRILTSRYATAAAAVALALTLVWADIPLPGSTAIQAPAIVSKVEQWGTSLGDLMEHFNNLFEGLNRPGNGGRIR